MTSETNMRIPVLLGLVLLLWGLWATPAGANNLCVAGSLSSIEGTTCDIGSLRFTFGGLNSQWSDSHFSFTPVSDGFSISFDGGPVQITAPIDGEVETYAFLYYGVDSLEGLLTGESVAGGDLSAWGSSAGLSHAMYQGYTYNADWTSRVYGGKEVCAVFGSTCNVNQQNELMGDPFADGPNGFADVFYLLAYHGNSASWDGTPTTITFATSPTSAPEPSLPVSLGVTLVSLGGAFLVRQAKT